MVFVNTPQPRRILVLSLAALVMAAALFPSASAIQRKKKQPCVATLAECKAKRIGCGGDPKLNGFKNRTDKPASGNVEPWKISEIVGLNEESPASWQSGKERDELEELGEGAAAAVKGWLINAHVTKTPETCNCYLSGPENNDFHLNLVQRKSDV